MTIIDYLRFTRKPIRISSLVQFLGHGQVPQGDEAEGGRPKVDTVPSGFKV